jgi:hypothetical protein
MDDEKEIKGRMALNKLAATMTLIGAIFCAHYMYTGERLLSNYGPLTEVLP